jgi:lipopolysaccharide transport system ATP-binding protein
MSTVIKVENLSKQYRLGLVGTSTFKEDTQRWWARMRGKEDPFLKLGSENDRTLKEDAKFVWSLKDINFEVKQGDILGVIGRNGAGKSTLLKILSKVTAPTTGSVKVKGRIASLLEVGTGFHPELTGRENIYLNGAILGMRKHEITRKLDEIIAFAGVDKYVDTPVKRYSSGMYVRLAFAVAAHLESEILIIDEVLAVGDAEFQQKCLGKMGDIAKGKDRTILFVSHNILAVNSICSSGILLNNGMIKMYDTIDKVSLCYRETLTESSILKSHVSLNIDLDFLRINYLQIFDNGINGVFNIDQDLIFQISFYALCNLHLNINIFVQTLNSELIFVTCSEPSLLNKGDYTIKCTIPKNTLNDNIYKIGLMFVNNSKCIFENMDLINIEGIETRRNASWLEKFPGYIRPTYFNWEYIKEIK